MITIKFATNPLRPNDTVNFGWCRSSIGEGYWVYLETRNNVVVNNSIVHRDLHELLTR